MFFDLDGMKFKTLPAQVAYVNKRYGIRTTLSDHIGRNHTLDSLVRERCPGLHFTRDEFYGDLAENFLTSVDWHKDVPPMDGMTAIAPLLAEKYTLMTVTARQKSGIDVIKYLLDAHIPKCISEIHCVYEKAADGTFKETSKKDFILSVSGEKIAFFDDTPEEIISMGDTVPSYLYDPDGLHHGMTGITNRVHSWWHIGEIFL